MAVDTSSILKKLRKPLIILIVMLVFLKASPSIFFLLFFYIGGFIGKWIRGQFGLSMVVLDPSLFFMILVAKFMGLKMLVIFLFFNIVLTDLFTGVFSAGSFINYVLYHIAPAVGVVIFGSFSMMVYGNIASLTYSVLYIFARTYILPDPPFQVWAKAGTSFTFTFLYISFFGPLFRIIMTNSLP